MANTNWASSAVEKRCIKSTIDGFFSILLCSSFLKNCIAGATDGFFGILLFLVFLTVGDTCSSKQRGQGSA